MAHTNQKEHIEGLRQKKRLRRLRMHQEGLGVLLGTFVFFLISLLYLYFALECKLPFWLWLPCTIVLMGLSINFYRFPNRHFGVPAEGLVVAPTDGTIVVLEEVYEPEILKCHCLQVSTFMTIFNVHAQWYPADGEVTYIAHHEGRFMSANLPKSSVENERSSVVIRTTSGHDVLVRQVAGAVARRIVTYGEVGDPCEVDDPLGFIKFGSRVDLYLPLGSEVAVELGQKVTGNQTLIARLPM